MSALLLATLVALGSLLGGPLTGQVVGQVPGLAARSAGSLEDHLEATAAALYYWDLPAAEAALARAQSIDPGAAATLTLGGRVHLLQGRYAEAVEFLRQAVLIEPAGMARHFLELAEATQAETGDYESRLTSGGHFLIRYAPGVDAVMVPYMDEVLERAWSTLVPLFGHEPPAPVRVELYPQVEVLGAVSSLTVDEIKTSGTIALCKYNRLMITSPRDLVYGYGWADTLAHEFIHMLVTQKSHNTVPIWLHEGLAKYFESRWLEGAEPALSRISEGLLAKALRGDELITFEAMSPSMAKLPSQEATTVAFAEVFTVVQFLRTRMGDAVAQELPALMGAGRTDQEAVAELAGVPWARFTPTWRGWVQRLGLRELGEDTFDQRLLFKGSDTEADELAQLEGDKARRFVWLGDRLLLKERFEAAAKEYAKAAAEVGDSVPLIQAKLGRALLSLGAVEQAIAALERPLPVYPDYVLLRLYLGEAWLRQGDLSQARAHLEAAIRINPFDRDVHGHLAEVYKQLGEPELAQRELVAHAMVRAE